MTRDYSAIENLDKYLIDNLFQTGIKSVFNPVMWNFLNSMTNECEEALSDEHFVSQLKQLKFDMIIVNRFPVAPCFHLVPYILNIAYVSLGTSFDTSLGGSPSLSAFTYNMHLAYTDSMNFWQRLVNFVVFTVMGAATKFNIIIRRHRQLLSTYASNLTSFDSIVDQSQLFFVTREHVAEWPLPPLPNVILVPPVNCIASKLLPAELDKIVESSKNGIIVVSFGSIADYLPQYVIVKMATAFNQLNYDIIWKFPFKEHHAYNFSLSKNVHIVSWLPQNDLLGHNNTKLFITHCGNNGQYESIYQGVPMVAFPLFSEQSHNAFRMENRGYGRVLDILTFSSEDLVEAVNDVINNINFAKNVKKASAILKDYPATARDTIAHWTEHVIKFGHHHLRSHAVNLTWYEYYMIDVVAFIVSAIFISLALIKRTLLYFLYKWNNDSTQSRR